MAVSYVGAASGRGSDGTNPTVVNTGNFQEGDYLLAGHVIDMDGIATYIADMTAAGFTEITGARGTVASCNAFKLWEKWATASEPANYAFTTSPPANGNSDSAIGVVGFRGVHPTTPRSTPTATTNTGTANVNHVAPSQAGVVDGMVVTFHSGGNGTENTKSYSAGTGLASATERVDANGGAASWVSLGIYTQPTTSTAATGTRTATHSRSTRHRSVTVVLNPAPAAVTPVADAGTDDAIETGSEWTRTGTGTNTPTSYSWSLTTAPGGVTTGVVDSDADLAYTPTVAGSYTFTFSATNAGGTGNDTVTLTVTDPVVAAGTLGKTTDGSGSSASSSNKTAVSKHTADGSGKLISGGARLWLNAGSTVAKLVVYADSSDAPGAKLAESDEVTISNTTEAVIDFVFSGLNQADIVSGTAYWIGPSWADPGTDSVSASRDSTAAGRQEVNVYAPDPFGTPTPQSGPIDAWVEYGTVGGGGTTTNPIIRSWEEGISSTTGGTVNKPTGLEVDDYLLALHGGDADTTSLTMAGFSALASQASTGASNIPRATLWGKVADSGDVAASTFAFGCTSTATPAHSITLMAIQKGTYDPADPVDVGAFRTQARTATALQTANSMTGALNGMLLGLFVADANGNAQTYPSTASGMGLVNSAQSASGYSMHAVYSEVLAAAGATGNRTVTPTGANTTQNGWVSLQAVVNPAPVTELDQTKFFLSA